MNIKPGAFMPYFDCKVNEDGAIVFPTVAIHAEVKFSGGEIASINTHALKRAIGCAVVDNTTFVEDKPKEGGAK